MTGPGDKTYNLTNAVYEPQIFLIAAVALVSVLYRIELKVRVPASR